MADDDVAKLRGESRGPYGDGTPGQSAPNLSGMTFKEVGSSGLRQYGGWVREEFQQQLLGRQAARAYREMLDNSSTIGAIIFAVTGVMRKVEWRTEPAKNPEGDPLPGAEEAAKFADSLRDDMSSSWEDVIAEALSMLGYGFAPLEIVYKRRLGPQPEGSSTPSSKYDDGKIGIRRLPLRGQDTVLKWFFGQNGEVNGLTQQPWIGPLIDIPIEKLLLFRPTQHKGNPEGRSILRNAWRAYTFIKRLEEQEAILFERLSGLPVLRVPSSLIEKANAGDPTSVASYNAYKKLVTNVRIDEQMGVILPSNTYIDAEGKPTAVKMYDFTLETPQSGRANLDANTPITRYKLDMLTAVLADFIQLGHEERGTQSLAVTKVDLFIQAIEGWLNSMAAVFNRHLLPRVWALNGMPPETLPRYVPDLAQRIDLDVLSNFILRLSQAGMPLFPDDELEKNIRDAAGLPDIVDDETRDVAVEAALAGRLGTDDDKSDDGAKKRLQAILKASLTRRAAKTGKRA